MGRRKKNEAVTIYSTPPETEKMLRELQDKFLEDKSNIKVKQEFFTLMRTYTRSLALKEIKRINIFLPPERVDEICTDATLAVFKQYEKPEWSILYSFAGIIYWKIKEAMYSKANDDKVYSLNSKFVDDDRDSKEIIDVIGTTSCLPWQSNVSLTGEDEYEDNVIDNMNVVFDLVKELIDQAYDILPYETFIKFIPWLVIKFRKPKVRNCCQSFSKMFLTNEEDNAFEILLLELIDRISKN